MGIKHHELSFAVNGLNQIDYDPLNQFESDCTLFPVLSQTMPEKLSTLVGRKEIFNSSHSDNVTEGALKVSEHHKRPLAADEDSLFSGKRPKHLEPNAHLNSHMYDSNLEWTLSGENTHVDVPIPTSVFPGCFHDNLQAGGNHRSRDTYPSFLDRYPRKPVAIGPNNQAIIPERRFYYLKNHSGNKVDCHSGLPLAEISSSADIFTVSEDDNDDITGTCIMAMPSAATLLSQIGNFNHNIGCRCLDASSARCTRQHIAEVRKNLKKALGHDRFAGLGFFDMGEIVADKWTEEEEHIFQEVVLSNPASLDKNFWDELPRALPSRSIKEFVSYYFNVFMLRKRAEQNRLDPANIDSDNDEWQGSEDGEYDMAEDEEDSALESPEEEYANGGQSLDEEVDVNESDESQEYAVFKDNGGVSDVSKASAGNSSLNYIDEYDNQDDSCTSFEAHHSGMDFGVGLLENVETWPVFVEEHANLTGNDGLGALDHGFFDGHCGPKTWDAVRGQKDDFFSTCNVIEEVFGDEP